MVIIGMSIFGSVLYVINKTYLRFLVFTPIFALIIVAMSNGVLVGLP